MLSRILAIAVVAFGATLLVHADLADAARLGAGRSLGVQRPSIAPSMPAPSRAPTATAPAPAAAAPAAAPAAGGASRWLGPIAGIAAGLGLAALLSHFGLSDAAGSFLLIALLAIGAVFLVRFFFSRRAAPAAGAGAGLPPIQIGRTEPVMSAASPPASNFEPAWGGAAAAKPAAPPRWPAGFEPAPFIENAKRQFYALQTANDRADRALLADVTTPEMFADIVHDLELRGPQAPTEIVSLDAEILEVTTEGDRHWASVRFTGNSREDRAVTPQQFDEVWNLVKPVNGSTGWLLAGIQQAAHAVS
jgi:predicted lipid-binding transport protein (Tim44 family)